MRPPSSDAATLDPLGSPPRRTAQPRAGGDAPLLGIVAAGPAANASVAGLSLRDRTVRLLGRAGCARVVVLEETAAPPGGEGPPGLSAGGRDPLEALLVAGDVVLDPAFLDGLVRSGTERGEPLVAVTARGLALFGERRLVETVARAHATGGLAGALGALPPGLSRLDSRGIHPAGTARERRAATRELLRRTAKPTDGLARRLFERRLAQALSALLVRLPVSPNMITGAALATGLVGAAGLASNEYGTRVLGALLVVAAKIGDTCDGTVARAKLAESRGGDLLDTFSDIALAAGTFTAVSVGVFRELGGSPEAVRAGVALLVGTLGSCAAHEVFRRLAPGQPTGLQARVRAWVDELAMIEWGYLVLLLALLGALDLFVFWAALAACAFAVISVVSGTLDVWRRARVPSVAGPAPAAPRAWVPLGVGAAPQRAHAALTRAA